MRWRHGLAVCLILASAAARAEMDPADYRTDADALSAAERAERRARIAEEIAAERARAEAEARAEEQPAQARTAAQATLPRGARLVEARCRQCHDPDRITNAELGILGWHVTILRMQWLNGAQLEPGERAVIAAHLAADTPRRSRLEWAVVAGMGLLAAVAAAVALAWRRRRRH